MIERLALLLVVALVLLIGWSLLKLRRHYQLKRMAAASLPMPLDKRVVAGAPSLLYFTSDGCHQCRLRQKPELERFADLTGIPIHELDAVREPELAKYFGVLTLPTTVLLDSSRHPKAINSGLTPLGTLRNQLAALVASSP